MVSLKRQLVLLLSVPLLFVLGCSSDQATEEQKKTLEETAVTAVVDENMNTCADPKAMNLATATVKNIPLEGGFWGLEGDDNQKYLPMNLDQNLLIDGAVLTFLYEEVTDQESIYQWGQMIRITEICSSTVPENSKPAVSSDS